MAAFQVQAGAAECILAGGTESMTMVPMMGNKPVGNRTVFATNHGDYYLGMGLTAENVAKDYKVSREDQDKFAYSSHQKAVQAIEKGWFKSEIAPVKASFRLPAKNGEVEIREVDFDTDEGPRPDSTEAALNKLRPAFNMRGSVTAGNSSQSLTAAMCLVVSEEF